MINDMYILSLMMNCGEIQCLKTIGNLNNLIMERYDTLTPILLMLFVLVFQPVQSQQTTDRKMDELTMIQEQVAEIRKQTLKRVRQNPEYKKLVADTGVQRLRMEMVLQDSVFNSIDRFLNNHSSLMSRDQIDSLRIEAYAIKGATKARLLTDHIKHRNGYESAVVSLLPEMTADLEYPSTQLVKSKKYLYFLITRALVHVIIDKGHPATKLDTYPRLCRLDDELLRDGVIFRLLMESYPDSNLARWTHFAEDAVSSMSQTAYRELLIDK